jgi:hypothetical protein
MSGGFAGRPSSVAAPGHEVTGGLAQRYGAPGIEVVRRRAGERADVLDKARLSAEPGAHPHPSIDPFSSETNAGNTAVVFGNLQGPATVMFVILVQQISNHLLAKSKRRIVVDQRHGPEFFSQRVVMQIEQIGDDGANSKANALTFTERIRAIGSNESVQN